MELTLPWPFKKTRSGTSISKRKSSSKMTMMSFDLLYQLSYMSVIAASGAPRNRIFEYAARLPCASAEYFKRIETAHQKLNYDYAKACRVVGETAESDEIKGLLLRLSGSLLSGEPEETFLERETESCAKSYDNQYNQGLETLKMWSDAYVSLVLSAVLIIVMGTVSTMIWPTDISFLLGMVAVAILATAIGVWLIYLVAPKERVILSVASTKKQKLIKRIFIWILPTAGIICSVLSFIHISLGWILLGIAAIILPIGILSISDEGKVNKRDTELGPFIASLGGVCAAIGSTVKDALSRIDTSAINALKKEVKRLNTRLDSGIRPWVCWQKFIEESGSEIAKRSVGMFYDAIELGGEPEQAGYHTSLFATRLSTLRMKRRSISSPFRWLCVAMHGAVVSLLIFITEVIAIFGEMVSKVSQNIPTKSSSLSMTAFSGFNSQGLEVMQSLVLPLLIVLSIANALAPTLATGGSNYKTFFNLSITTAITSMCLLTLPSLAKTLFQSVQHI